jgi:hypothetical protein
VARRSRFEPSGLVAGLLFLAVAAGFGCEAAGVWHPSPALTGPVVVGGLLLVAITRAVTDAVRRRRGGGTGGVSRDAGAS